MTIVYFSQRGDRLQKSESDVFRRQILTSVVGPRAERVKTVFYCFQPLLIFLIKSTPLC